MRRENSRSPDLAEVLRVAMQQTTDGMFVAMPGQIAIYDPATQTADILPMLQRPVVFDDGTEDVDLLPIIPGVPIAFPRGGGAFITFPLIPGDLVMLVFCDRSVDKYKSSPGTVPVNPIDLRTNDISDAVAFPGFYPVPLALKDAVPSAADMAMGFENGTHINITQTGSVEVTTAGSPTSVGGYVAMANLVATLWTTLWGVFNGWVVAPNDGGAALKTAFLAAFTTAPTAAQIGSTNLKAD